MRAALPLCLLLWASPAEAFLFGRAGDERAAARLSEMRLAFARGDCGGTAVASEKFFGEKPPPAMREEAYGYLGRCHESSGSTDKAIVLYELALGLYPENSFFSSRLALIYNASGFPAKAAPLFLKTLALKPGDQEATLGLARAYAALGYLSRAAEAYRSASEAAGYSDAALTEEYASCLLRKRDWDGAAAAAARGLALGGPAAPWRRLEARTGAGRGDYAAAVAALDSVPAAESTRELRLERSLYLLLGGRKREAAAAAAGELERDPLDPLASQVRGMALYALGDKAGAQKHFEAARAGGPFTSGLAAAFLGADRPLVEEKCAK